MTVSEVLFSGNLHYMETCQFICILYQLAGYYVIQGFTERCFLMDIHIAPAYIHLEPSYEMTCS